MIQFDFFICVIWKWSDSVRLDLIDFFPGLILNPEPYYNEAGYEKQKGSQQGLENSRLYNEMAILKLVQVRYLVS